MRPRISSAVPTLIEQRTDSGGALLCSRRLGGEQPLGRDTPCGSDDALANESCQSGIVAGTDPAHRLEAGNRAAAINDEHGRPALDYVNQRAEIVLGFGDTRLLHNGQNRLIEESLQAILRRAGRRRAWPICLKDVASRIPGGASSL